ncbi:lactonase family protein [Chitinasiproducens palmae]|uniref:6-phosphogluconolactonase n=1 Tax=Chitinasiproducens palmae TaxID=1770053 RepID=A0A1H2PLH5_9BURK|nr:beta-propeller fold lactonase family protein [Chitinasiproducens palmae]SDV47303.1 6-phosphogluconolactonase [Chitinasiproducens palmae]
MNIRSVALVASLIGCVSSVNAATYVYIANADDHTISMYAMDNKAGTLRAIGTTPVSGIVMPMAVSPDRRYLYASIRTKPYAVESYVIDSASGRLDLLGRSPLPESMAYISTDRGGRYLFGASFGGDVISVSPIGAQGVVQRDPVQVIKTGPHAHSILPDPSNRFVYVGNLGVDRVLQFRFDAANGKLTPIDRGYTEAPEAAGPRHQAASPDGRFLYVVNELAGTVTQYTIDQASGALARGASVQAVPAAYGLAPGLVRPPLGGGEKVDDVRRIWAADVHASPDGRFLFVSERTSSSITTFRIDPHDGSLTFAGNVPVESQPRGFNIEPRGRFMVVAGEKSPTAGVYAINPDDGSLKRIQRIAAGKGANWVEIVDFN